MEAISAQLSAFLEMFGDQPYLQGGVIIFLGFLISKFISKQVTGVLVKISDRFNLDWGKELATMLTSPIFYLLFLAIFSYAVTRFPLNETVQGHILAVFKSVLIIIWASFIYKATRLLLSLAANDEKRFQAIQPATLPLFENIMAILLGLGAVHQIFAAWNVVSIRGTTVLMPT